MREYKNFMNQLEDLKDMEFTCRKYTEWSTSDFESDLWNAVQKNINNLIKYYEKDK